MKASRQSLEVATWLGGGLAFAMLLFPRIGEAVVSLAGGAMLIAGALAVAVVAISVFAHGHQVLGSRPSASTKTRQG